MKILINIETGALGTATSSAPLSSRTVCMLSLRAGFVTWRLCNNSLFEILVSLRYNKWFEDARACKLLKLIGWIKFKAIFILFFQTCEPMRLWEKNNKSRTALVGAAPTAQNIHGGPACF